jgi:hypothetical protein
MLKCNCLISIMRFTPSNLKIIFSILFLLLIFLFVPKIDLGGFLSLEKFDKIQQSDVNITNCNSVESNSLFVPVSAPSKVKDLISSNIKTLNNESKFVFASVFEQDDPSDNSYQNISFKVSKYYEGRPDLGGNYEIIDLDSTLDAGEFLMVYFQEKQQVCDYSSSSLNSIEFTKPGWYLGFINESFLNQFQFDENIYLMGFGDLALIQPDNLTGKEFILVGLEAEVGEVEVIVNPDDDPVDPLEPVVLRSNKDLCIGDDDPIRGQYKDYDNFEIFNMPFRGLNQVCVAMKGDKILEELPNFSISVNPSTLKTQIDGEDIRFPIVVNEDNRNDFFDSNLQHFKVDLPLFYDGDPRTRPNNLKISFNFDGLAVVVLNAIFQNIPGGASLPPEPGEPGDVLNPGSQDLPIGVESLGTFGLGFNPNGFNLDFGGSGINKIGDLLPATLNFKINNLEYTCSIVCEYDVKIGDVLSFNDDVILEQNDSDFLIDGSKVYILKSFDFLNTDSVKEKELNFSISDKSYLFNLKVSQTIDKTLVGSLDHVQKSAKYFAFDDDTFASVYIDTIKFYNEGFNHIADKDCDISSYNPIESIFASTNKLFFYTRAIGAVRSGTHFGILNLNGPCSESYVGGKDFSVANGNFKNFKLLNLIPTKSNDILKINLIGNSYSFSFIPDQILFNEFDKKLGVTYLGNYHLINEDDDKYTFKAGDNEFLLTDTSITLGDEDILDVSTQVLASKLEYTNFDGGLLVFENNGSSSSKIYYIDHFNEKAKLITLVDGRDENFANRDVCRLVSQDSNNFLLFTSKNNGTCGNNAGMEVYRFSKD